jgi:hypothetical protein
VPKRENCASFVTHFLQADAEFPDAWKAALVSWGVGGLLLLLAALGAVLSLCARTACGKSVFALAGLAQSVAGMSVHSANQQLVCWSQYMYVQVWPDSSSDRASASRS